MSDLDGAAFYMEIRICYRFSFFSTDESEILHGKNLSISRVIKYKFRRSGPSEARDVRHFPPLNPEERGMSGPEPPRTEARLHGWLLQYLSLILYRITFLNVMRGALPRRLRPCDVREITALTVFCLVMPGKAMKT